MFYLKQAKDQQEDYQKNLELLGSLSNLFSDSDKPYLAYRVAEKLFCNSFKAEDLSRHDIAVDAKKNDIGIGVKTFVNTNNKTFQKVAEFSKESLGEKPTPKKIAQLRNDRINFTEKVIGVKKSIYHCVLRERNRFKIFEEPMNIIDISNINDITENKRGTTHFNDGQHDYSFSSSKSTLSKRFNTDNICHEFEVQILKDPLQELHSILKNKKNFSINPRPKTSIFLPLYGLKKDKKFVFERSGLNQWNAKGRARDPNEVYIRIPILIHRLFPKFFPPRDTPFFLKFPDGEISKAKVCQANGKALMTKENKKLGRLLLRDNLLGLKENELVTYSRLESLGVDSVEIIKNDKLNYEISFAKCSSYETFINNAKISAK